MGASKRPGTKTPKRKSKARQTTLSSFAAPATETQTSSSVRRSTRGSGDTLVVPPLASVPAGAPLILHPSNTKKPKKPKQQTLQLQKQSTPPTAAAASSAHEKKTPNFAVVIYTRPKSLGTDSQPGQTAVSWFEPGVPIELDEDDEDDITLPVPEQKLDKGKEKGKEIIVLSTGNTTDEDEDMGPIPASARKKKAGFSRRFSEDTQDTNSTGKQVKLRKAGKSQSKRGHGGSDGDSATRRKLVKGKGGSSGAESSSNAQKHREVSKNEDSDQDIEEDISFLSQKHFILPSRTRYNGSSPKKNLYQKKLAELRAKKAGRQVPEEASDSDEKPRRALYDTDEEDEEHDRGTGSESSSNPDEESWIIEDDENAVIGAPDVKMPIEFTHLSHQTPLQNFRIFCLWVVQSILNPDFPRDDEISIYAIRAIERKMDSYSGSVLQSSIWQAPFMRAMLARPVIEDERCDERPACDACGKANRPAMHAVTFTGDRYDKETLEDYEGSEADDSQDINGEHIPDSRTVFYLGRNCHQRASMSHAFIHWKKQLRDEIHSLLQEKGYFTPFWVNKAAKMDPVERTRWADTITEGMDEVIRAFYHDLKRGLEAAQKNMTNQRSGRWR